MLATCPVTPELKPSHADARGVPEIVRFACRFCVILIVYIHLSGGTKLTSCFSERASKKLCKPSTKSS